MTSLYEPTATQSVVETQKVLLRYPLWKLLALVDWDLAINKPSAKQSTRAIIALALNNLGLVREWAFFNKDLIETHFYFIYVFKYTISIIVVSRPIFEYFLVKFSKSNKSDLMALPKLTEQGFSRKMFGSECRMRVLVKIPELALDPPRGFTIKELRRALGDDFSPSVVDREVGDLCKLGLLSKDEESDPPEYSVDVGSPTSHIILEMGKTLMDHYQDVFAPHVE